MFKGLSLLNLKKVLSQMLRGKFEDLPFQHLMESKSVVEAQPIKISLVEWLEEECHAESGIPTDFLKLWHGVAKDNNFKDHATHSFILSHDTCKQCNCLNNIFLSHCYQNQALQQDSN